MGEKCCFQPLTREDRITVFLYRLGIVLSTLLVSASAFLAAGSVLSPEMAAHPLTFSGLAANIIILSLFLSVGLSVFFIHLYVGKFHRVLKKVYYFAVVCLAVLFVLGEGSPASLLFRPMPAGALLLIPLSLCLGFITAKEAFCFKLPEGYLLAVIMPGYLFFYGAGLLDLKMAAYGLVLISLMLLLFMVRKVFQPLHFDIGDKSAYQP